MHRLEVIAAPSISYGLLDRLLLALEMELLLMLIQFVLLKLVLEDMELDQLVMDPTCSNGLCLLCCLCNRLLYGPYTMKWA